MHRQQSMLLIAPALLAVTLPFLSTASAASAQRTFVASYGSTANTAFNCSIAKPCRQFSEAIGVTSAGGEVIVLDSAGYGSVTVTKSVSIISSPGVYAGISVFSGSNGVTVNAPGATVVLRGLSINGQGGSVGIALQAAARLRVESCVISKMVSDGIQSTAAGAETIVLDTIIRDNGGAGMEITGDAASAVIDRVRIEHNLTHGLYLAPAVGSLGASATVADSVYAHNGANGIFADSVAGGTTTIVVERTVIASNGGNGFAGTAPNGSEVTTLMRNTINDNGGNGIWIYGSVLATAAQNAVHRNSLNGILAEGPNAYIRMSSNMVTNNLVQDADCISPNGQVIFYGNNVVWLPINPLCRSIFSAF